ncbi:MAG: NADH-quinone oxidoreductase subunit J [Planctomycetota bacterium]|nr:NADH-quinone oxidoreductase subunit J [Planctomycetota bacterium]MCX8039000.1 NADH-quinone oxidoreductase subunit J [Planctomycetota bacterium]MDW8372749.1 NADH-quinone oxidoreductase subunit J [Planctomycetota bacterium]
MFPHLDATLADLYFALLALAALICGVGMVLARHPLNAAVLLIGVMLSLAGIYALLDAPFLAVLQVLVYAGAVMMLMVFVIMVLNRARSDVPRCDWLSVGASAASLLLTALLASTLAQRELAAHPAAVRGEPEPISALLFAPAQGWWLLFVAIGVTLLTAVVGAVLLAKRSLDTEPKAAEDDHAH